MLRKQINNEIKMDVKQLESDLRVIQDKIKEQENKLSEEQAKLNNCLIEKEKDIQSERDLRNKQLRVEKLFQSSMFYAKTHDYFRNHSPRKLTQEFKFNIKEMENGRSKSMLREIKVESLHNMMIQGHECLIKILKNQLAELKQRENQIKANRLLNIIDCAISKNRFHSFIKPTNNESQSCERSYKMMK